MVKLNKVIVKQCTIRNICKIKNNNKLYMEMKNIHYSKKKIHLSKCYF